MHPQIDRLTTFPGVFPIKTPIYMATSGSTHNIQTHPYVRLHLQIILQYSTIILHDTCNIYLNMSKNILYQTLYGYKHLKNPIFISIFHNQSTGGYFHGSIRSTPTGPPWNLLEGVIGHEQIWLGGQAGRMMS